MIRLTPIKRVFNANTDCGCMTKISFGRFAMVMEKSMENEIFSRSGKSQGISILVREI